MMLNEERVEELTEELRDKVQTPEAIESFGKMFKEFKKNDPDTPLINYAKALSDLFTEMIAAAGISVEMISALENLAKKIKELEDEDEEEENDAFGG